MLDVGVGGTFEYHHDLETGLDEGGDHSGGLEEMEVDADRVTTIHPGAGEREGQTAREARQRGDCLRSA